MIKIFPGLIVAAILSAGLLGGVHSAAAETAPSWAHPTGTAVGIAGVDSALRAIEAKDASKLQALFLFTSRPCTNPGIGAVECPAGQPVGTPVEVFGTGQCEGVNLKQGDPGLATVASLIASRTLYLYAVGTISPNQVPGAHACHFLGFSGGLWHHIVAERRWPAVMIFTDSSGIRSVNTGCSSSVAQRVQDLSPASFALAPRVPGPPNTGTTQQSQGGTDTRAELYGLGALLILIGSAAGLFGIRSRATIR